MATDKRTFARNSTESAGNTWKVSSFEKKKMRSKILRNAREEREKTLRARGIYHFYRTPLSGVIAGERGKAK